MTAMIQWMELRSKLKLIEVDYHHHHHRSIYLHYNVIGFKIRSILLINKMEYLLIQKKLLQINENIVFYISHLQESVISITPNILIMITNDLNEDMYPKLQLN